MKIKINQTSSFPLDYHFRGDRLAMKPLFDQLISIISKQMAFEYKIGKAYIGLLHTLVFAAIHVQTKKIIVEFTVRKLIKNPRIKKTLKFQKSRWAYFVEVKESKDIDNELINWLKQSYE